MLKALLDILFPPLCHACKAFIPCAGAVHLCAACRERMIPLGSPLCPCCGRPFATQEGIDHPCGYCLTARPPYRAARAALCFTGPTRELIHRFKYSHHVRLRRPLGFITAERLAGFIRHVEPALIIPVPLHGKRLRQRGFNQALLLGEVLARTWRIPLSRDNLRRMRWTEPQVTLTAAERALNVKGAFAVRDAREIKEKRLILVDDVYTTGSTVVECVRTLLKAGAAEVCVVTVARAVD